MKTTKIEAGGLDALEVDRVVEVLIVLRENANKSRRLAGNAGSLAAEDKAKGYHASAEHGASIAARYARIAMAYEDAMLWIMAATSRTEFSVAVGGDEAPSEVA